MFRKLLLFCLLYCVCVMALPINATAGVGAASFLRIHPGARGAAMGGAYAALANDAYGAYWNPAGPATLENIMISSTVLNTYAGDHSELAGVFSNQYFVGLAIPRQLYISWGIYLSHFGVDDIEIRNQDKHVLGTFSDTEDAVLISIARRFYYDKYGAISLGICLNLVQQKFGDFATADGRSMDFGILYEKPDAPRIRVGLVWKNLGGSGKLLWDNGHADILNRELAVGFAYTIFPQQQKQESVVAFDIARSQYGGWQLRFGVEAGYETRGNMRLLARAGYRNMFIGSGSKEVTTTHLNEQSYPNIGFGFEFPLSKTGDKLVCIDYAIGLPKAEHSLGWPHRVSISLIL